MQFNLHRSSFQSKASPPPPREPAAVRLASAAGTQGLSPSQARAQLEQAFGGSRRPKWVRFAVAAVWLLAISYYVFMPATYVSKWTLIVPVSNSGTSIALDSIGQTTTTPGQHFGSLTLSPKVIYREIAGSEKVREAAAGSLGLSPGAFGRPRVKLVDETSLLLFQMKGRTPEDAQRKALALMSAFEAQLDNLRKDEGEKRALALRDNLKQYQSNLDAARERVVAFQRKSGLRSLTQFNEMVSAAEGMRRKIAENRAELERLETNQSMLVARIGLRPNEAAAGLRLSADPAFAKLAAAYAEANGTIHEYQLLYGPNHPALTTAQAKIRGAINEITRIAKAASVDPSVDLRSLVLLITTSQQAELLRTIVHNESQIEGRRKEIGAVDKEVARAEADISRLSVDAAKLENLKKDYLVAEAVFTSAVARLDTNKSDLYSSYPMVQMMAAPDLPTERSQPQLIIAIAAGIIGSLLVLLAGAATWVRRNFGRKLLKSL